MNASVLNKRPKTRASRNVTAYWNSTRGERCEQVVVDTVRRQQGEHSGH